MSFGSKHKTKEIMESSNQPDIIAFSVIRQMGFWKRFAYET